MTAFAAVGWLRDRADSYQRDSVTLAEDDDVAMAAAYRTIARELRVCAGLVGTVEAAR